MTATPQGQERAGWVTPTSDRWELKLQRGKAGPSGASILPAPLEEIIKITGQKHSDLTSWWLFPGWLRTLMLLEKHAKSWHAPNSHPPTCTWGQDHWRNPQSVPGLTCEFHGRETQCQGRECLDVSLPKSRHRITAPLARWHPEGCSLELQMLLQMGSRH